METGETRLVRAGSQERRYDRKTGRVRDEHKLAGWLGVDWSEMRAVEFGQEFTWGQLLERCLGSASLFSRRGAVENCHPKASLTPCECLPSARAGHGQAGCTPRLTSSQPGSRPFDLSLPGRGRDQCEALLLCKRQFL